MNSEIKFDIFINKIAQTAVRALLYEVAITPKPGLVDRYNQGSHRDMDFFTFIDSSISIQNYFIDVIKKGFYFENNNLPLLFDEIRELGKIAEITMFDATNNINTHKGLIFSLGLIYSSFGYLINKNTTNKLDIYSSTNKIEIHNIFDIVKKMLKNIDDDFLNLDKKIDKSNGEKLYLKYGITGIRGEAASGFKSITNISYPVFTSLIANGHSINDSSVQTLLHLIANVDDTNVLNRQNYQVLSYIKNRAAEALKLGGIFTKSGKDFVIEMDKDFISKN